MFFLNFGWTIWCHSCQLKALTLVTKTNHIVVSGNMEGEAVSLFSQQLRRRDAAEDSIICVNSCPINTQINQRRNS